MRVFRTQGYDPLCDTARTSMAGAKQASKQLSMIRNKLVILKFIDKVLIFISKIFIAVLP